MRAINSKCSSIPHHHRFPLLVFNVLLLCLTAAAALEAPLWVQRRKMERFHQNEICLRRRREELEQFGLQPLRALVVVENQTMWLRCFDCLHPDDADELEDVWKPSPSFIGRKLQKFLKLIKDKIARARKKGKKGKVKAKDNHLAQFRWQHHSNGVWKPAHEPFVTDEPGTNEEKGKSVKNFIDEIMSKDGDEDDYEDEETKKQNKEKKKQKKEDKKRKKTMYIGDHLELEVRRLNRALHQGWFRCVRMNKDHSQVSATSQLVHVDVLDHVNVTMLKVDSDAIISSNEDDEDDEQNIIESGSSNSRGGSTTVPDKDGSAAQRMAAVHKFSFPNGELQRWLQVYAHASDWTPCNKCGNRTGEKRRSVSCHVRLNPKMLKSIRDWNHLPDDLQIFWSFAGHLPCASSQLPQSVRAALPAELRDQVYEEFTECTSVCTVSRHGGVTRKMRSGAQQNLAAQAEEDNNKSSKNRTDEQEAREEAVIRQMEGGEVLDVLPAGEFAVSERLPPLPPPIIRKTIFATKEQPLQLDCSNQDGLALIWRKNFEELNGSRMLADERHKWIWDEEQRRQLTADGQLLIRAVRKEDSGLYSCTAFPGGHILRTFRIYFVAGDRTKELLEYMSLIFRILLFAYLLILMLDLLNVDVPNV